MTIQVILTKSFTNNPEAGNPAGVVADAQNLTDAQILKLAQELRFPESAFLQKSTVADHKLRLFSVKQEVNSCVTATLAAAAVVTSHATPHVTFETKIGNREVFRRDDGLLLMKQPRVEFLGEQTNRARVAELLNIPLNAIADLPIVLASAGTPKLLIPMTTLDNLFAIRPDLDAIATFCQDIGCRGFYPFTLQTKNKTSDFHARQFNPQDGIAEDPVTGVAAAALAKYLHKYGVVNKPHLVGEQGYIINKPGEIIIEFSGSDLFVGGYVTVLGQKELNTF